MGQNDAYVFKDYYPDKHEFVVVGVVGTCLYSLLALSAAPLLLLRVTNATSKKFFMCILAMCLLELPRYLDIAITAEYSSTIAYSIHLMAASFFFAAFSFVCYQWSGLLQLGSYSRAVYSRRSLLIVNAVFSANDLFTACMCGTSSSLNDYFDSTSYEVYVLIEAIRNLVYSSFLLYFGLRLILRFRGFIMVDKFINIGEVLL